MYGVEMASCRIIYLESLVKAGIGVQAVLRVCLRNLRDVVLVLLMRRIYELRH
jgi:hypothetical protein